MPLNKGGRFLKEEKQSDQPVKAETGKRRTNRIPSRKDGGVSRKDNGGSSTYIQYKKNQEEEEKLFR